MKNSLRSIFLVTALLMHTAGSFAQDATGSDDPLDRRMYTVEMIIFSYDQSVSAGTEIFVPDAPPPLDDETQERAAGETGPTLDDAVKFAIVPLAEKDLQLIGIAEKLGRLGAYRPLMHFGWRQTTYPDEAPESRPLSAFATPPPGLEGELTLYLSRFLHLAVNLQLDAAAGETGAMTAGNDSGTTLGFAEPEVQLPVRYRIEEDRIFKNGDIRYFDHPKFGVIAKVTRVETEPAPGDFESGEMLGD